MGVRQNLIEQIVENQYGLHLRSLDHADLVEVIALYEAKRSMLWDAHGPSAYGLEEYRKAFYVAEAARKILKEIMPRGRRKKKSPK